MKLDLDTQLFKIYLLAFLITGYAPLSNARQSGIALKVGDIAPDINLSDPEGKPFHLSSLRGKIVLIDFWASWCGYCKMANEEFIPIFHKYNSEGFEIVSISLDEKKEAWINGIKNQNLPWTHHVSDLHGWDSKIAATYGVESLPSTFLIDEHGVIIAMELDEYDLEKKLNWVFYEQIRCYPHITTSKIHFTQETKYQIEDLKGTVLLKGKSAEADLTDLSPGDYVVKFDGKSEKIIKKGITGPGVTFYPERADDKITLSKEAEYVLYNHKGKVIKKGKEHIIHVAELPSGIYYLVIEGSMHSVFKK